MFFITFVVICVIMGCCHSIVDVSILHSIVIDIIVIIVVHSHLYHITTLCLNC